MPGQEENIIIDKHDRAHDYLRISLTERCNLRCFYCMPEEGVMLRDKAEFMTGEETIAIAQKFVEMGVKKIRLTGGEPLIKKNAEMIIRALGELPIELAITTNGVLVDRFIDVFKDSGIKTVNVSLDSLVVDRFNKISRRNYYDRIIENIRLLISQGFNVKINVVVMRGENDGELVDFVKWSTREPVEIRFIEFMPFDGNNWNWDKKVSFKEIIETVTEHFGEGQIEKMKGKLNDTSRSFKIKGAPGTFGIISTVTNPFCDSCNRIRLTADGKIKNCLFSNEEVDLLKNFREGKDIEPLIRASIWNKHAARAGHPLFTNDSVQDLQNRSMTSIGG